MRLTASGFTELVGEAVHCLRILGVSAASGSGGGRDRELAPVMQGAVAFLLAMEHKYGQMGLFVPKSSAVYERYHAAFCGFVGLIDSPPLRRPEQCAMSPA